MSRPVKKRGWTGYAEADEDEQAELEQRRAAFSVNNSFDSLARGRSGRRSTSNVPQADDSGDVTMDDAPDASSGPQKLVTNNKRSVFATSPARGSSDIEQSDIPASSLPAGPRIVLSRAPAQPQMKASKGGEKVEKLLAEFHAAASNDPIKSQISEATLGVQLSALFREKNENERAPSSQGPARERPEDPPQVETGRWRDDNGHFLAVYIPDAYLELLAERPEKFEEATLEVLLRSGIESLEIDQYPKFTDSDFEGE